MPKSYISVKPVQKPHPPIYMAAFASKALQRVAKMADGWIPVAIPIEGMMQMFGTVIDIAKQAGRDPSKLEMVVRANLEITAKPLTNGRIIFQGTPRADPGRRSSVCQGRRARSHLRCGVPRKLCNGLVEDAGTVPEVGVRASYIADTPIQSPLCCDSAHCQDEYELSVVCASIGMEQTGNLLSSFGSFAADYKVNS